MDKSSNLERENNRTRRMRKTDGSDCLRDISKALQFTYRPKKLSLHWSESSVLVKMLYPLSSKVKAKLRSGSVNYLPENKIRRNTNQSYKRRRNRLRNKRAKNISICTQYSSATDTYVKICKRYNNNTKTSNNKYKNINVTTDVYERITIEVPAVTPQHERLTKSTAALNDGLKRSTCCSRPPHYALHDKQSLVMCVTALGYSKISSASAWSKKMLHKIFTHSCRLYERIVFTENSLPCLDNLPSVVVLGPCLMRIKIRGDYSGGIMKRNSRKPRLKSLCKGLDEFFKTKHSRALLKYNSNTCAVWKQHGAYFLFELYPRTLQGERRGLCTASLQKHETCHSLARAFLENVSGKEHDCIWILHAFTVLHIYGKRSKESDTKIPAPDVNRSSAVEWSKIVGYDHNDDRIVRETLALSHQNSEGTSTNIVLDEVTTLSKNTLSKPSQTTSKNTILKPTTTENSFKSQASKDDVLYMLDFLESYVSEVDIRRRRRPSLKNDNHHPKMTSTALNNNRLQVDSLSTIDLNSSESSLSDIPESTIRYNSDSEEATMMNAQPVSASTPKSSVSDMKPADSADDKTLVPFDDTQRSERVIKVHEAEEVSDDAVDDSGTVVADEKTDVGTSSTELEKVREIGKTASEQAMNLHEEFAYFWLKKPLEDDSTGIV